MSDAIDWQFIGTLEGQSVLTGYVPDPTISHSGVTIATGVDLGQLTQQALRMMCLDAELFTKLMPYAGLREQNAVNALAEAPLTITQEQSDALDAADRAPIINALRSYYTRASDCAFASLPPAVQTVLASVAFQYGPHLAYRTPHFWAFATEQYWQGMIDELKDFGDDYPSRRKREAAYLIAAGLGT
jgi:hypothetical protein